MAVGNLASDPEPAVTGKVGKKACPVGHLDFEKQLRWTVFQVFVFVEQHAFVRWKVFLMLLKHCPSIWQLASSQGIGTLYGGFTNLGSYLFLFIQ